MAVEKLEITTGQKVKAATKQKMNSDQTTTQCTFMVAFMVLICGVLQAIIP
jgi:hypothetical protein